MASPTESGLFLWPSDEPPEGVFNVLSDSRFRPTIHERDMLSPAQTASLLTRAWLLYHQGYILPSMSVIQGAHQILHQRHNGK